MKVTAQKVRAILRKAGFAHAKTYTTSVKGYHQTETGYRVIGGDMFDGLVLIKQEFEHKYGQPFPNALPYLERYAAALAHEGIQTELVKGGYNSDMLKVVQPV